jgi:hypothetical protein
MNEILVLPAGPLADASLAIARASESQAILDHSIRSFLFARLLADHEGCLHDAGYDEDLLFAATVMHDLGLGEHATGAARFEVEGADLAAAVLRQHGIAEPDIDRVWEAIALHSSVGIADRRGLLTSLTHKGVFIDAGRITDAVADRLRQEVSTPIPDPPETAPSRTPSWPMRPVPKRPRLQVRSPSNSFANTEKPSAPECGARNRPEGRQPSWPTNQLRTISNGWTSSTSRAGTERTGRASSPATTPMTLS